MSAQNRNIEADGAAGTLPVWNLDDLYPGRDSQDLTRDLEAAAGLAGRFRDDYHERLAGLDGDRLAGAIGRFEAIDETLSRIMSYAQLEHAAHVGDPEIGRFFQTMRERVTDISAQLLFFTLEINRIGDDALKAKLASPELAAYRPWLRDIRVFRAHELSDDMERLLHEKQVTGAGAWNRLFEETIAELRFTIGGEALTEAEAMHRLSSPDRATREVVGNEIGRVFGEHIRLFAHITNTLAKDKAIEDGWRHYGRPDSARNLVNHVEDDVVDALAGAVKAAYPVLSHRYYALKAKWLGLDKLAHWDRNAPLPAVDDRSIPWAEAQETVLAAYARFSPQMADIGKDFFARGWIDAEVRPGKSPGAFSHPTVPAVHPYILMNYQGKTRDVMTLAHELGHGVHQVLAAAQGHLMASTPLTLAETASVFGEMLTFRSLLDRAPDAPSRRAMLAGKVEDMLNTVVRQIAFYEFEKRVHAERRDGELLPERIGEIWLDVQTESLGPAFDLGDEYRYYWAYIPHFIVTPFYVYAYAFGDCLVNSLYAVYQTAEAGFAEKYLDMLRAGGTLRHRELLAPFGLDASDPAFWQKGLGVIQGFIDELEEGVG